jgi:transposase
MDMTMSSIRPNRVEVVTSVQRRRRWTPEQKLEIVKQSNEPGSSVSLVARQHGLTAAQLFQLRKLIWKVLWSQLVPMKLLSRLLNFKKP